jgi:hypothetical protein
MNNRIIFLLILFTVLLMGCARNRLKTDEKSLVKQILTEEEQRAHEAELRAEREIQLADSLAKLPKGFRLPENRNIDSWNAPEIINIERVFSNRKNLKLSELVKENKYIQLEKLQDKNSYSKSETSVILTDSHIIISGMNGLFLYGRDGLLEEVVCESETPSGKNTGYKGVWGEISVVGETLLYRFADNVEKKHFLIGYNLASTESTVLMPSTIEGYQITGKGEVISSLAIENEKRFTEYVPLGQHTFAGYNSKIHSSQNGQLMTIFSNNDDTLSNLRDYETISNYTHTLIRGNFPQNGYQYNQMFTFLNAFSDTVFRVIPPNRLLPVYVLQMGKYKITPNEGFSPGVDISSKLYVDKFSETRSRIFLRIKQDYDSPVSRKAQTLKVYFAIYDKYSSELVLLPVDPIGYFKSDKELYERQGISNNIDGGLPFWPEKVSASGEMYQMIKGDELKAHIRSDEFKNSDAPQIKKDKLVVLANQISPDQLVLIVYK